MSADGKFRSGLAHAFGGAFVFSFPLLMTMEMWWLGFYMDRLRLALCVAVLFPLLLELAHHIGFDESFHWKENLLDTLVAYAVGYAVSALMLVLFGVLKAEMSVDEWVGKISLQAIPASLGAMLARSQFGSESEGPKEGPGYARDLFMMLLGALFLGLTAAPTEEMILISFQMSAWHSVALIVVSLLIAHAFAHAIAVKREKGSPHGTRPASLFLRFTMVAYAIALCVSAFVLWSFGRFDHLSPDQMLMAAVVLAFPANLGAAAARLIL